MSGDRWTRDQKIAAVAAAAGVAGVVVNFVKPITDAIGPYYWLLQPFLFLGLGAFMGFSAARALDGRRLAEMEKTKREHEALFKDFCCLTHDEQRQVVGVMLSEPGGLEPTDGQRVNMGSWVKMRNFLRHDPVSDRMHLVDGVRDMLLENPGHVYDLMAARVASLEVELAGRPRREDVEERDATISSLEAELERRPTIEEVDARVVEAIGVFVDATAAKCDELSKTPDDRLRERVSSGEVSGFEARVLGEVLGLDAHPRRWLRSALEEGYVDVEDRVIGDYDRLGHFRNLVTAVETGLPGAWGYPMTRYVLNDSVRDVLESFPEVFELVDRDDEEIARIVSGYGGKPYDPETAAYRRVSR